MNFECDCVPNITCLNCRTDKMIPDCAEEYKTQIFCYNASKQGFDEEKYPSIKLDAAILLQVYHAKKAIQRIKELVRERDKTLHNKK